MKTSLTEFLQGKEKIRLSQQIAFVCRLSIPAILAQVSSILMQYIDAAMVGNLGAEASASIGIVATTTWLMYGISSATRTGFSVQVAQAVGAGDIAKAKQTVREAIIFVLIFSCIVGGIVAIISPYMPQWLKADSTLQEDASSYLFIFALSMPALMLSSAAGAMLECSGNMKTPSILNASRCIFDIIFNAIFIFPSCHIKFSGINILIPGFGLKVKGAALGTAFAELLVCICLLIAVLHCSPILRISRNEKWKLSKKCMNTVRKISLPIAFEQMALCGAQIAMTGIVAPLGTVALAADSFGVTAESLCYMPGFGIQSAATTLVGQSIGAKRQREAKRFGFVTVACGMIVMAVSAISMYFLCPSIFKFLTPDERVQDIGTKILRIELIAEPLFGASIVAAGALRGAGDTLVPGIMTLVSIWGVRLTLGKILSSYLGITGVWIAMCIELCIRGILMIVRLCTSPALKIKKPVESQQYTSIPQAKRTLNKDE